MNDHTDDDVKLVSIEYFVREMMGYASKATYYNHLDDPGFPQRVYPGGKPMLVLSECRAYIEALKQKRQPPTQPFVKARRGNASKPGRPRKLVEA